MNGSRQRYRLDDYLQDKAQRAASPLARGGSSGLRQGMAVTPTGNASVEAVKPLPVRPPHTVQRPSGTSYNASGAGGGQNVTVDTLKPDAGGRAGGGVLTQSQMTTAYTKQLMENALSNLLAMQNRKFEYDARSSPLYSIVQKQAEENARLASGRAYAQAKAATGGYGSSYDTLAADEAGRQAMRELDDQQLALYEAARSEFEAENASALDWYNTTKQLYEDAYVLEQDATESGMTAGASDAYNYVLSLGETGWNGANEEAIRTMLNNQATAGGWTSEDVEKAISMLKAGDAANVADMVKNLSANPTMSGAAEAYLAAKQNGTLDQYAAEISKSAKTAVEEAIKKAGDDVDMQSNIMAEAAQAVKDGYLAESDYIGLIISDVGADIKAMKAEKNMSEKKMRKRVAQSIEGVIAEYEEGNLSEEGLQMALVACKPFFDEYFSKLYGSDKLGEGHAAEVAEAASVYNGLNEGERNAIYKAWKAIEAAEEERRG